MSYWKCPRDIDWEGLSNIFSISLLKKYKIYKLKNYSIWYEMFKIASVSGAPPQTSAPDLAGGAHDAPPDPLVVSGFLPSAICVSRLRRLQCILVTRSGRYPSF